VASTKAQVECIVFHLKKGGKKDLKFPFKNFGKQKAGKIPTTLDLSPLLAPRLAV